MRKMTICYTRSMSADTSAWHRLPGETDTQWAYFMVFREWAYPEGVNGPFRPRVLGAVAEELGIGLHSIQQYSSGASWFSRASAYDMELERAKVDRSLGSIAKMRVRKERVLGEWDTILTLERAKLLKRANDPDVPAMTVREMSQVQEMILKHEALLHGLEPVEEEKGIDWENLPEEDLAVMDRITAKQTH